MLAVGKETDFVEYPNKQLIATDPKKKTNVYFVEADSEELPFQKLSGNSIFDWIRPERFHKLTKRWSLTKKEAKLISGFFSKREDDSLDLGEHDNYRVRSAFEEIERLLIQALKSVYNGPSGLKLRPHFTGEVFQGGSTQNCCIQGPSGSGKTTWAVDELMKPAYSRHHIVVISATPTDPSFDRLRRRRKKITTFVDLELIKEPMKLALLINENRPTLLFVDDVFDSLSQRNGSKEATIRLWIADLVTNVLTRGRVNNISTWIVLHRPKGGRITENLYGESSIVVVFPRNNREVYAKMVREKLGIAKKTVDTIFERAGRSRYIVFRIASPMCAIWETGAMLL